MLISEVLGNLGADVEVKNEQGYKFATFRVAHADKWTDQNGQEHRETTWVDCILNNIESKVLDYLKAGVKVYVRGNTKLRVFSSAKEKRMKAGLTINVRDIELCGGTSDAVPSRLIVPDSGQIVEVSKFYWANADTKGMEKNDTKPLIDERGGQYTMNSNGFVFQLQEEEQAQGEQKGQ